MSELHFFHVCIFHPFSEGFRQLRRSHFARTTNTSARSLLARVNSTLALVGFLHRLEHVGVTRLWKETSARFRSSWIWHLSNDREIGQNVDERLADTSCLRPLHRECDSSTRPTTLEKVLQHCGAHARVIRRTEPLSSSRCTFVPSIVLPTRYDDGLSGHLKANNSSVPHAANDSSRRDRYSWSFLPSSCSRFDGWRHSLLVPKDFNLASGLSRLDS